MNGSGKVLEQPCHNKGEEAGHRLGRDQRQVVQAGREVVRPFGAESWTARYHLSCDVRFRLGTDRWHVRCPTFIVSMTGRKR